MKKFELIHIKSSDTTEIEAHFIRVVNNIVMAYHDERCEGKSQQEIGKLILPSSESVLVGSWPLTDFGIREIKPSAPPQ